jgi:methionyl-tRNA formyltransferase
LPVLQPERLTDAGFLEALAGLHADLGVVTAYGKILTDAVLATPRLGLINVHASLLPRYRGAAPVHRAVIGGETETGVTIVRMVKALDAGPMLARVHCPIGPDETSDNVERSLATMGAQAMISVVDALAAGEVRGEPQDESAATYAHRLTKEEGAIDWARPAAEVHNLIRGLHPWPHAFTFYGDQRLILLKSAVVPGTVVPPGAIVEAAGDRLHVAAGRDTVAILEIQVEGKRPMTCRQFLAGHRLSIGELMKPKP